MERVFETVLYRRTGNVARVTLNRPQRLNAFSVRMRDDLYEALDAIRVDDARVLVVDGAGERAFCAGADLSEFLTAPSAVGARRIRAARDLWGQFRRLPQPSIAALQGHVLGSGLEIALFCDLRIAADDCVFALPEPMLGILPGAGATQTLPRTSPLSQAAELVLAGRPFDANDALDAGLVSRVVPRAQLEETALRTADAIARCEPAVARAAKRAVLEGAERTLRDGLALERRLAGGLRAAKAH